MLQLLIIEITEFRQLTHIPLGEIRICKSGKDLCASHLVSSHLLSSPLHLHSAPSLYHLVYSLLFSFSPFGNVLNDISGVNP